MKLSTPIKKDCIKCGRVYQYMSEEDCKEYNLNNDNEEYCFEGNDNNLSWSTTLCSKCHNRDWSEEERDNE